MNSQMHAFNARAIGNFGLWEKSRRNPDPDRYDVQDESFAPVAATYKSRLLVWRGQAIRWSLASGVFLAYLNHWPGGH